MRQHSYCMRKPPWNKGLTKKDHPSLLRLSEARKGENNPVFKIKDKELWKKNITEGLKEYSAFKTGKTLEELYGIEKAQAIKQNQSSSAFVRPKTAGHHTPHSEETKNKLRAITAKQITDGKLFISKLQKDFFEIVKQAFKNREFILQYQFGFYSIDIALPALKIAIEVDGDFWHANEERGYPVKYDVQKRNKQNEKCKNSYIANKGWTLIRFWESDIKENLQQCLNKLDLLIKENQKNEI